VRIERESSLPSILDPHSSILSGTPFPFHPGARRNRAPGHLGRGAECTSAAKGVAFAWIKPRFTTEARSLKRLDPRLVPVDEEPVDLLADLDMGGFAALEVERVPALGARDVEPEGVLGDQRRENRLQFGPRQRLAGVVDQLAGLASTRGPPHADRVGPKRVQRIEIPRRIEWSRCVAHHEITLRTGPYCLTGLDFPHYIPAMDAELAALEEKVRQAAELCQRLREENRTLRQQLAQLELDRERLTSKVEGARERLESLLRQIPE